MKILIIGGSGQVSSRVAKVALCQNHEVWALTRGNRALPQGVHAITADRNDPQSIKAALSGMTFDAALDCICMNAEHARIDLEAIVPHTQRIIVISTDSVYHPSFKRMPQDENGEKYLEDGSYGAKKREMELVFEKSSANYTLFRPGHIVGPGFAPGCFPENMRQWDLPQKIRAGEPMRLVGGGTYLIHPIVADDLAQAMLDCIENPNTYRQTFCIGGPDVVTNAEYFHLVGSILGAEVTIESIPEDGYLLSHPESSGQICERCYTLEKLRQSGVPLPKTSLEEGLRQMLSDLEQKGAPV